MILPSAYTAPRLIASQHAMPSDAGFTSGRYFHLSGKPSCVRSNAYSTFGNGVTTYIVLSTTSGWRSEEHTSELQSRLHLVCRLLLEKKQQTHHRSTFRPNTHHRPPPTCSHSDR